MLQRNLADPLILSPLGKARPNKPELARSYSRG
jgi:hypothetical protein